MSNKFKPHQQVYAVVRLDFYGTASPEHSIAVKEIAHSLDLAQAEVERLNRINADKQCTYFWQATRLYPPGMSASTREETPGQPAQQCASADEGRA